MSELSAVRRAALACVSERRRRNARMRDVLAHSAELAKLSDSERALASRLALICTLCQTQLDDFLDAQLTKPKGLEPRVRDALRLSAAELLYFETPEQVAVSQGVELVRSVAPRAAGLANAVLRKLGSCAKPQLAAAQKSCEQGSASPQEIALYAGMPPWLADQIYESLGPKPSSELALSQLEAAPIWLAANPRVFSDDSFEHELLAQGFEPLWCPWPGCVQLKSAAGLRASELIAHGTAWVSDLAAQLICALAAPNPGETLLEVGQGIGTKSLLMAAQVYARAPQSDVAPAQIFGIELHESRVNQTRARLEAAGFEGWVSAFCMDGRKLATAVCEGMPQSYDRVFVDAPCSGTGTMRRHPETPITLRQADVRPAGSLPQLQAELLAGAASRVRAGGLLIYSTCSVLQQENASCVQQFLGSKQGNSFELIPLTQLGQELRAPEQTSLICDCVTEKGYFQSYPIKGQMDGHFCAVMRRST